MAVIAMISCSGSCAGAPQHGVERTPEHPRAHLGGPDPGHVAGAGAARDALRGVKSWGYQLQGPRGKPANLDTLADSPFDLLVVDLAASGNDLTAEDVARLASRPGGDSRVVLAYMSIGEAEDYRWYWQAAWRDAPPGFLVAENTEWAGNYKVRYWQPEWQRIILGGDGASGYLDRIVDAGFDGVYLDIVDAFEYFGPDGDKPERDSAARDMAAFVEAIAEHARERRGQAGFLVVPQNGANILDELEADKSARYLETVDAIGAEDTFFYGDRDENNDLHVQTETVAALRRFRDAGKLVLAVDYLTDEAKSQKFVRLARAEQFVPYVGRRALDRLVKQPE